MKHIVLALLTYCGLILATSAHGENVTGTLLLFLQ
jgi:hypothetical protein